MKDGFSASEPPAGNAAMTLTATCLQLPSHPSSATAVCPLTDNEMILPGKLPPSQSGSQDQKSSKTLGPPLTISVKGLNPYWDAACAERSSRLWLPTETDSPVSDLSLLNGLSVSAAGPSWFSTTLFENQNGSLPKTYSPSFMSFLAASTASEVTRARRIKLRPSILQRKRLNSWLGTYRFIYNETVWLLNLRIVVPNFMAIKKYLIPFLAEEYPWTKECPRAIRDGAVAEACQSVKAAIGKYKRTGEFSRVSFKSRKDLQQSFFLRNDQWSTDRRGFNVSALGTMQFSEALPMRLRDGRVMKYADTWYVSLPESKTTTATENQGRLVALDPGVRTFQTFFSDQHAGHLGQQDIQRIVRLVHHLDGLLSRRDLTVGKRVRLSLTKAANRIRERIRNLVDELHWKVARFLTDNFDVILLPTFETKGMTAKASRRIRKKSVRQLLSFSHYRFSQRLEQKCLERGKRLIRVCEAYTSKTASWTGQILPIRGSKRITSNGITVNRDINGARGIFLRALVDSPALIEGAR